MRQQTLIWTALPNGHFGDFLALSVFVSPRLTTDEGGEYPPLDLFPDFMNWPETLADVSFSIAYGDNPPEQVVAATGLLDPGMWTAVFNSATRPGGTSVTYVRPYQYIDYSAATLNTYPIASTLATIKSLYQNFGVNAPTEPPVLTVGAGGQLVTPRNAKLAGAISPLLGNPLTGLGAAVPLPAVQEYYDRPAVDPDLLPLVAPTLDFHQTVSALTSFPALLPHFGLVFNLRVPHPPGATTQTSTVVVTPTWTSAFTGASGWSTVNVSPPTSYTLSPNQFIPTPLGPLDYHNGMLDLADTSRFSVTELDVDGAAFGVNGVAQNLYNVGLYEGGVDNLDEGATMALTLPSLRSVGPTVVRTGWASALNALTARQTDSQNQLTDWLEGKAGATLPTFYAEDLIKGHRIDVYTASEDRPQWLSLVARTGSYSFGPDETDPLELTDEGCVVPGATGTPTAATPPPAPADLWVNEHLARWSGWSLAAPRVGNQINPDDSTGPNPGNPAAPSTPDANGNVTPQMSAAFSVPPGTLPKLRFGNQYQYRARAMDLAGNGPPPSVADASTATAPMPHYRYQPAVAPVPVAIAPYTPGTGTLTVALLNDGVHPITPSGRWLFPAKVSQLLCEEHGMFDGFSPGRDPDPTQIPNGDLTTFALIAGSEGVPGLADGTVDTIPSVKYDPVNGAPYILGTNPQTPWFPDPMSWGVAMLGLPTDTGPTVRQWAGGPWPTLEPMLLQLVAGAVAGHSYTPASADAAAFETVTLPPAAVYDVRLSTALDPDGSVTNPATNLSTFGVWQWIAAGAPPSKLAQYVTEGNQGQLWLLTPYATLRMIHAVRLPQMDPGFVAPKVTRSIGDHTAQITDKSFAVDARSTTSLDVQATWTDPIDDPANPSGPTTLTTTGPAFKVTVPDPAPLGATEQPGWVTPPPSPFALSSAPGVTHDLGDTKFHLVSYTATGTSRFAEFFRTQVSNDWNDTNPVQFTEPPPTGLGVNAASVEVTDIASGDLLPDDYYTVDPVACTLALVPDEPGTSTPNPYIGHALTVSFEPVVTLSGAAKDVFVLSSSRPAPPQVAKVVPAWQLAGPAGSARKTGIRYARTGGFLRVYLDRPWFSSGADELLGVVTLDPAYSSIDPPGDPQAKLVTLMGLDPISLADPSLYTSTTPQDFGGTVKAPNPPGRPPYAKPYPLVTLAEDPSNLYQVNPYVPTFDPDTQLWYVDVDLQFAGGQEPPPGYFVRLALVRFQPYSISGVEVSPVVLASFSQPVSDRSVLIVAASPTLLRVQISGPAYQGFRPADDAALEDAGQIVEDYLNDWSTDPYSYPGDPRPPQTSAMVCQVQVQDTSTGLSGDLAWVPAASSSPVMLSPVFEGSGVSWAGDVTLPATLPGATKMRLHVSEIDYYDSTEAPAALDTTRRRPFVAHIPLV